MLVVLRIALYIQFLFGAARMLGWLVNQRVWETHVSIGLLAALIALFVLRPHPRIGTDAIRTLARFAPTVTLAYGLFMYMDVLRGMTVVWIHIILGVITISLVEMAAGRQRRALRQ